MATMTACLPVIPDLFQLVPNSLPLTRHPGPVYCLSLLPYHICTAKAMSLSNGRPEPEVIVNVRFFIESQHIHAPDT